MLFALCYAKDGQRRIFLDLANHIHITTMKIWCKKNKISLLSVISILHNIWSWRRWAPHWSTWNKWVVQWNNCHRKGATIFATIFAKEASNIRRAKRVSSLFQYHWWVTTLMNDCETNCGPALSRFVITLVSVFVLIQIGICTFLLPHPPSNSDKFYSSLH